LEPYEDFPPVMEKASFYSEQNSRNTTISNNYFEDSGYAVYITGTSAHNNTITNNIIRGGSSTTFFFSGSDNNTITYNNITLGGQIDLYNSESNNVSFNQLYIDSSHGMYFRGSSLFNKVHNNTIRNIGDIGIRLAENSAQNELIGNDLVMCGFNIQNDFDNFIEVDNTVNGKPILLIEDENDVILDGTNDPNFGQIIIKNCSEITIKNFNIKNASIGLLIVSSNNLEITDNIFSHNQYSSIFAFGLNDSEIINCECNYGEFGIWIKNTMDSFNSYSEIDIIQSNGRNNITSNDVMTDAGRYGIYTQYSVMGNINENFIKGFDVGMYLYAAFNSSISDNHLESNIDNGIYIEDSVNNTLIENIIHSSSYGLEIYTNNSLVMYNNISNCNYGAYLDSGFYFNVFSANEFWDIGTSAAEDNGDNNYWSLNGIGNYWEEYNGVDANNDGIGDTPFDLDGSANAQDSYPIIGRMILLNSPNDISGNSTTLSSISWSVNYYLLLENPNYVIKQNGTQIATGLWISGNSISINIANLNLEPGIYSFTIILSDGLGNQATDTIIVSVLPDDQINNGFPWGIIILILGLIAGITIVGLVVLQKRDPEKFEELKSKIIKKSPEESVEEASENSEE
jgi:parallel beta-helix repeat protein